MEKKATEEDAEDRGEEIVDGDFADGIVFDE